jgi:DNA polymerase-3 subunit gamma/tau
MDAASHGGVDDARQLRERAEYAPNRDRYKIIILDEAHMITNSAFNALLKLVEEPPEHIKFIFATTEPEKVISTIRSRTYHYAFSLVPKDIMVPYLEQIASDEGVKFDEQVFPLLARVGGGSVRDTLSFMDQLIASAKDGKVEYDFAVKLFGFTPEENISAVLNHLGDLDFAGVFDDIEALVNTGVSPKGFATDLLQWIRDAILVSIWGQNRSSASIKAALGGRSDSELELLKSFVATSSERTLTQYAYAMQEGIKDMRDATSQRLQLELVFAKMASFSKQDFSSTQSNQEQVTSSSTASSRSKPSNLPTTLSPTSPEHHSATPPATAPANLPTATPATLPLVEPTITSTTETSIKEVSLQVAKSKKVAQADNAPAVDNTQSASTPSQVVSQSNWGSILKELSKARKSATVLLDKQGRLVSCVGQRVEIAFNDARFGETFSKRGYSSDLENAIANVLGSRFQVSIVDGKDLAPDSSSAQDPAGSTVTTGINPDVNPDVNPDAMPDVNSGNAANDDRSQESTPSDEPTTSNSDDNLEEEYGDYSEDDAVVDDSADALSSLQDILGATEIER